MLRIASPRQPHDTINFWFLKESFLSACLSFYVSWRAFSADFTSDWTLSVRAMVRSKQEGRYRKSTSSRNYEDDHEDSLRRLWTAVTSADTKLVDDRKTYASKVRSLIEKKHRSLRQVRKTSALREILSAYPKNIVSRRTKDDAAAAAADGCCCGRRDRRSTGNGGRGGGDHICDWDVYNCVDDPDLCGVYESQKLNFRRMVSSAMSATSAKDRHAAAAAAATTTTSVVTADDSDFNSWSDLESNFSLIYEPLKCNNSSAFGRSDYYGGTNGGHFDPWTNDDVVLTLEKVKNMKNSGIGGTCTGNERQRCSSACDSWSFCACSTSDASSFLSTCTCCQRIADLSNNNKKNNNNDKSEEEEEESDAKSRMSTYEPVPAERIAWSSQIKQLKQKLRASTLSRTSSSAGGSSWDSWNMYANFESIPLAIASKEKRMKALVTKLKEHGRADGDDDGWSRYPESVRIGLIYVPMQEEAATAKKKPPPPPVPPKKPRKVQSTTTPLPPPPSPPPEVEPDPFGSLESIIFEPKDQSPKASIVSDDGDRASSMSGSTLKNADETATTATGTSGIGSTYCREDTTVGSYWDWDKVRASRLSCEANAVVIVERSNSNSKQHRPLDDSDKTSVMSSSTSSSSDDESKSTLKKDDDDDSDDDTFVSEVMRSSSLSECKTLAGTSVASWTYIGSGHRHKSRSIDQLTEEDEQAEETSDERVWTNDSAPVIPKKAVTWNLCSEQTSNGTHHHLHHHHKCAPPSSTSIDFNLLPEAYTSWSDLESLIFATDDDAPATVASIKDVLTYHVNCGMANNNVNNVNNNQKNNRMSCYRNDWLYWDQQRKLRRMPATGNNRGDQLTWRNKAKRMLLWMHYSQGQGQVPVEQWSWWKAKMRASILWLICKANGNKVPDDLRDPYYKDHEDRDQLKPLIVHALASAEYYCLALGNIYADQNYHHLNHWGVIQALSRKGVYVAEPSDVSLTETVLIQTSPIRMSAHMAVIEAMMALYLKETVTVERIIHAVRRFVPLGGPIELPTDVEEALVFWINKVCVKMKHRIEDEMNIATSEVQKAKGAVISKGVDISRQAVKSKAVGVRDEFAARNTDESYNVNERVAPPIPLLQDLGDLSDGCSLATVISYYCPSVLRWQDICLNDPMSMADSLYNIQLMQKFCRHQLPFDPCFLTLEDLVYQHSSIRQNILVFLAELFYMFEVRPSSSVKGYVARPEVVSPEAAGLVRRNGHGGLVSSATKRSFHNPVSPIPDLRTSSYSNISADSNRLNSKNSSATHVREPLLPRRQLSQHDRMQDRSKRFSFTDGPNGCYANTNSMRRTHSMQDIDKNGDDAALATPAHSQYVEPGFSHPATQQPSVSTYPHYNAFGKENQDDGFYNDANELYSRSLTVGHDAEPLMPAIVKPAKEKSNRDSKPEEMGESVRHGQHQNEAEKNEHDHQQPQLQQPLFGKTKAGFTPVKLHSSSLAPDDQSPVKQPDHHFPDVFGYNQKNEKFSNCDFPDNRDVEEHLRSESSSGGGRAPYSKKQQFLLMTDDGVRLKEGLESLGSSESGIFMDKRELFPTSSSTSPATTSFAQLSKLRDHHMQGGNVGGGGGINIVYMQQDGDSGPDRHPLKSSFLQRGKGDKGDKKASFANLPNQTTWQQQDWRRQHSTDATGDETATSDANIPDSPLAAQLCDVRLKLNEKRRRIESEKKKMEMMMVQMRQKVGKAAFLQAMGKRGAAGNKSSANENQDLAAAAATRDQAANTTTNGASSRSRHTPSPDLTGGYDEYGNSFDQLNSSLSHLQTDLQQLTLKEEEIQSLMHNGVHHHQQQQMQPECQTAAAATQQFYLHDDGSAPSNANREWVSSSCSPSQQQQQRSPSREQYHPLQRSQSREQLYQPMQRSQSRELLYQQQQQQPMMQRSQSREQLYQQSSLQRSASREQLYQPSLQRTVSREQLYQPMQRSVSREQLYHHQQQQPLQRSVSREQLYQPQQLHRSPSHEIINYQLQPLVQMDAASAQWSPQIGVDLQQPPRSVSVGPILGQQQHAYVDQSGFILQAAPPSQQTGFSMVPQYIPVTTVYQNGPPVDYYGQYAQPQASSTDCYGIQQAPFRLHMDVGMSPQPEQQQVLRPSSRCQSPMTYQVVQPPRPPSRPPSVTSFPSLGHVPSLPAKATSVAAPPEFSMEPQSVHFIERPDGFDVDVGGGCGEQKPYSSLEHVVSGTATYRVREPGSPTRPLLGKTFRVPKPKVLSPTGHHHQQQLQQQQQHPHYQGVELISDCFDDNSPSAEKDIDKGFFVSFDSEQPKRPKPPLRTKKVPKVVSKLDSPDKELGMDFLERPQRMSPQRSEAPFTPDRNRYELNISPITRMEPDSGSAESDVSGTLEDMVVAKAEASAVGLIIGSDLVNPDPVSEDEMARRKEKILMSVIKRKEEQETLRAKKEMEAAKRRESDRMKQELIDRKKDEERARRQAILEQYKQRKASLEDQEGGERYEPPPRNATIMKNKNRFMKPRPKSLHESALSAAENRAAIRMGATASSGVSTGGSQLNLVGDGSVASGYSGAYARYAETDSMGRSTPPRRAQSPGHVQRLPPSPILSYVSPPGAGLPPGLVSRRIGIGGVIFSDTASDSCSTASSTVEYTGPKLFKQPTAKSNRGIIINAINAVLAGAVNADTKKRVLEEIAQSDSKHFLILFRDAGCQFRALYSYAPEKEEVFRLMGTGPKQVTERMMNKFYKYNCGGRNFTDIQTKHLTVTIDAFTIHNSLWQTKKPLMPKKEYL